MLKKIKSLLLSVVIVGTTFIPVFASELDEAWVPKWTNANKLNEVYVIKNNKGHNNWGSFVNDFGAEIKQTPDNRVKDSRVFGDYSKCVGQWFAAGYATVTYRIPKITKTTKYASEYSGELNATMSIFDYGDNVQCFIYEAPHSYIFGGSKTDEEYYNDIFEFIVYDTDAANVEGPYDAHIKGTNIMVYGINPETHRAVVAATNKDIFSVISYVNPKMNRKQLKAAVDNIMRGIGYEEKSGSMKYMTKENSSVLHATNIHVMDLKGKEITILNKK